MKNYLNEPNPLNTGAGKGSSPRNLSKKFRDNYDKINWKGKIPKNTPETIQKMLWQQNEILKGFNKGKKK